MSEPRLARKAVAEALGSAMLLATVVGSGIMAERLAAGNGAVALLCNTLATGAMLVVLIVMLAPISGAHLNPAVSMVAFLRRELSGQAMLAFVGAQLAGALLGVLVAHGMFEAPLLQVSAKARSGMAQIFSEGVATFGLILTILLTRRARPEAVATSVGLYIVAAYWFTASTSFANPAVTIARAATDTFSGIRPDDVAGFVVAQVLAAMCGLVAADALAPSHMREPAAARDGDLEAS